MNKMYFRGSHGVVLVCDMCDSESYQDLDTWIRDFIDNNDREDIADIAFVLLANKVDIVKARIAANESSATTGSAYTKNRRDLKSSTASSPHFVTEEDLQKWCITQSK
jgi:GTPase SAR1 family protein